MHKKNIKKDIGIGPRIDDVTATWITQHFETLNGGATTILQAWPTLYQRRIKAILPQLSGGEISLLIDLHNGYAITPQILGQGVLMQVADGIELEGLDQKWGVARDEIMAKLDTMHPFDLACLEIWATAFWQAGYWEKPGSLEEYIKQGGDN